MEEIVIVKAKRSAIGKLNGSLKNESALSIAKAVAKDVIADIPTQKIDTIYLGNVLQAGNGQNIARQLSLQLDIPHSAMATTVNAVCGSGMQAIILGIQALKLKESDICLVGGTESMTNAPFLLKNYRNGHKFGNDTIIDSMQHDGLFDHHSNMSMIDTAEKVSLEFHISKDEQDLFAYESQVKAHQAQQQGKFKDEIVEINEFNEDEYIRKNIELTKIKNLKPVSGEYITAANASGINDGAAILLLMRKSDCIEMGLKPLAVIEDYAASGCDNTIMGYAPYYAIKKLCKKMHKEVNDFDLIEINEAFSAQVLAVQKALGIKKEKLNVNGGAIALGHPIGASGARVVVSSVHALHHLNKETALISLCIGGGNALAMAIKKYEENI